MAGPNLQSPTNRREAAKTKSLFFFYSIRAGDYKNQIFAVIFMIMEKVHVVGL